MLGDGEMRRQSVVSGGARRRRRKLKGEEGGSVDVGVGVGEVEEAGSRVGGKEWEHHRRRRGREADATGKKGKREMSRLGRGRRSVAGEDYPIGRRWGEGRRRFCWRGEERGERGKDKGEKEKKEMGEKLSRKIETEKESVSI